MFYSLQGAADFIKTAKIFFVKLLACSKYLLYFVKLLACSKYLMCSQGSNLCEYSVIDRTNNFLNINRSHECSTPPASHQ